MRLWRARDGRRRPNPQSRTVSSDAPCHSLVPHLRRRDAQQPRASPARAAPALASRARRRPCGELLGYELRGPSINAVALTSPRRRSMLDTGRSAGGGASFVRLRGGELGRSCERLRGTSSCARRARSATSCSPYSRTLSTSRTCGALHDTASRYAHAVFTSTTK